MTDADASEATIQMMYRSYYAEMGGAGSPPRFLRAPAMAQPTPATSPLFAARPPSRRCRFIRPRAKPRLPVALIFACLVVVYVGIRYYWR